MEYRTYQGATTYPGDSRYLRAFYPEVSERLPLPTAVPDDIAHEFNEGELCLDARCFRASAAMFRSVLEKTLKANGYDQSGRSLRDRIDDAATDGAITTARRRRAHDEVRVLGNDVLHDEWREVSQEDALASRHYAQRVLEDFYDDREEVERMLSELGRLPKVSENEDTT